MFAEVTLTAGLLDKVFEYLQGLIWFGFWLGIGAATCGGVALLILGAGFGMGSRRRDG